VPDTNGGMITVTSPPVTISNLLPFTNYMFSVVAANDAGTGPAQTLTVQTSEAGNRNSTFVNRVGFNHMEV